MIGCSAPEVVRKEASLTLSGVCKKMFLAGFHPFEYQYMSEQIGWSQDHGCSFALSIDKDDRLKQACGWASIFDANAGHRATPEEVDAVALTRCEGMREKKYKNNTWAASTESTAINGLSCEIFARDNNIIWQKKSHENLELE